jgi:hypothetical protein
VFVCYSRRINRLLVLLLLGQQLNSSSLQ